MAPKPRSKRLRHSRKKAEDPKFFQHKVTTGKALFVLAEVDGRSALARRFRDLIGIWTENLGGTEFLSEAQRQLIRRAASISLQSEVVEAEMCLGLPFDPVQYLALSSGLVKLCVTLGLETVPRGEEDQSIEEYVRERYAAPDGSQGSLVVQREAA